MHWLRIIAVLLVVALLQATVVPAVEVRHVRPDLLLLVALYVVVREPPKWRWCWNAFWVGWTAGLIADIFSPGSDLRFGATALVFGLLAAAMNRVGAELFLDSAVAQVLILAPACLIAHGALGLALTAAVGGPVGAILARAFWTACYSALVAPLVFAAMKRLERFLGIRSRRSFGRA